MTLPVEVGTVLSGKFRVERVLNAGGMGVILVAHHLQLDQRVAIKVLRTQAAENPQLVTRFGREARAIAKLKSEHVVRVLDVGMLENGSPYMVMEHLRGSDLSRLLQAKGPLPIEEAVDYLLQACEGLAEAHGFGIVHRDLKPGNLFLTRTAGGAPLVKVLDFGISKVAAEGGEDLTTTSAIMGSLSYISPEQLRSARSVDSRADIWALGAVLFRMVTGKVPFAAPSEAELVVEILHGKPRSARGLRDDLPEALEAIILRCLAKNAEDRFASVSDLASALEPFASGDGRQSVPRIGAIVRRSGHIEPTSSGNALCEVPIDTTPIVDHGTPGAPRVVESETVSEPGTGSILSTRPLASTPLGAPTARSRRGIVLGVSLSAIAIAALAWTELRGPSPGPSVAGRPRVSNDPAVAVAESAATAGARPAASVGEPGLITPAIAASTPARAAEAPSSVAAVAPTASTLRRVAPVAKVAPNASTSTNATVAPAVSTGAASEDPRFGGSRK